MKVFYTLSYLFEYFAALSFGYTSLGIDILTVAVKRYSMNVFSNQINMFRRVYQFVHLDNVGMIHFLQDGNLSLDGFSLQRVG